MKQQKKFFLMFLISSCRAYDLGNRPPIEIEVDPDNAVWSQGIQSLIAAKCDTCHQTGGSEFEPYPARFYRFDLSFDEDSFRRYLVTSCHRIQLHSNPMPPAYATPLTDNEREALLRYCERELSL
jgi:hypothetical protein